jgi:hypothetical protein
MRTWKRVLISSSSSSKHSSMLVTREVFTQRCAYSRPKFFASNAVEFAYLAILKHMTSSGDPALHLMDALARSSREDTEYDGGLDWLTPKYKQPKIFAWATLASRTCLK